MLANVSESNQIGLNSAYKNYKPISDAVAPAGNPYAANSWEDPVGGHSYNNDEVGVVLPAVIPLGSIRGSASSYAASPSSYTPDLELSESIEDPALAEDLDIKTVFNPNDLTSSTGEYDGEYEYYDDEYEYYYVDEDEFSEDNIDTMPEMIDLRGSQPLVVDNYAGRRR